MLELFPASKPVFIMPPGVSPKRKMVGQWRSPGQLRLKKVHLKWIVWIGPNPGDGHIHHQNEGASGSALSSALPCVSQENTFLAFDGFCMTLSLTVFCFVFFFLAGNNKTRAHEAVKKIKQETLNSKGTAYGELGPSLGRHRVTGELPTPAWP